MFMTSCFIGMISCLKRCNEIGIMSPLFYIEDYDDQLFFSSLFKEPYPAHIMNALFTNDPKFH